MATLGLILYVEPLQNALARSLRKITSAEGARQITGFISDAFVVTIAAQITTTPIIALYFGRLSLLSLPANFLIIPAQTPLMVFGGLAVIVAFVSVPIGQVIAWVSWVFLSWTIGVVRFFAGLPHASMELNAVSPMWVAGVYALIFASTWLFLQPGHAQSDRWKMLKQTLGTKTIAMVGSLAAIILFAAAFSLPDGRLHITFVDVDSGTAVLIATPSGRYVLVDAGGSGRQISATLGDELPFWSRRLDLVVLTRPGPAHTNGLPSVLGRYEPGAYLTNASLPQKALDAEPGGQRVPVAIAQPGTRVSIGDGVSLTVLYSGAASPEGDDPTEPISLLLTYGDARFLLPGDPTSDGITELLNGGTSIASTVLYLPQDRGEIAASQAFLTAANPQVVIIAVKDGKPLKPPDEEMLTFLEAGGSAVYRTDQAGSVQVATDGKQLWIETAKSEQ
jgi:competence protein ComEC